MPVDIKPKRQVKSNIFGWSVCYMVSVQQQTLHNIHLKTPVKQMSDTVAKKNSFNIVRRKKILVKLFIVSCPFYIPGHLSRLITLDKA